MLNGMTGVAQSIYVALFWNNKETETINYYPKSKDIHIIILIIY